MVDTQTSTWMGVLGVPSTIDGHVRDVSIDPGVTDQGCMIPGAFIGQPADPMEWIEQRVPSGKLTELWKITMFNGKIHYKWPFSC